jgi:hypothetical protein
MRGGGSRSAVVESGADVSFKELLESWREHAAAPRTAGTWAVRLPLEDAARLAALADMFPGRSPEQLITELLGKALKEVVAAMPYVAGKRVISTDDQGDPVYEDVGPTPRFIVLARRHYTSLRPATGERPGKRAAAAAKSARAKQSAGARQRKRPTRKHTRSKIAR